MNRILRASVLGAALVFATTACDSPRTASSAPAAAPAASASASAQPTQSAGNPPASSAPAAASAQACPTVSASTVDSSTPVYPCHLKKQNWKPGAVVAGKDMLMPALRTATHKANPTWEDADKVSPRLSDLYIRDFRAWTKAGDPATVYTFANDPAVPDHDGNVVFAKTRAGKNTVYAVVDFRPRHGKTPILDSSDHDSSLLGDLAGLSQAVTGPAVAGDVQNGTVTMVVVRA